MKKLTAIFFSFLLFFVVAIPAFAAPSPTAAPAVGTFGNLCPTEPTVADGVSVMNFFKLCALSPDNPNLIPNIMNVAFIVVVILALAFLIYGGIKWITSGGDKTKVEGARNTIVAALVGLVIAFLAYFILQLIFGLFGISFGGGQFWTNLTLFNN